MANLRTLFNPQASAQVGRKMFSPDLSKVVGGTSGGASAATSPPATAPPLSTLNQVKLPSANEPLTTGGGIGTDAAIGDNSGFSGDYGPWAGQLAWGMAKGLFALGTLNAPLAISATKDVLNAGKQARMSESTPPYEVGPNFESTPSPQVSDLADLSWNIEGGEAGPGQGEGQGGGLYGGAAAGAAAGTAGFGGNWGAADAGDAGQGASYGLGGASLGGGEGGEGGGGGGGSGGGKVLCTELYRQGKLTHFIYQFDSQYGRMMHSDTVLGYRAWAEPIALLMRKSPLVTSLLEPFIKAWAYEMSYELGAIEKGSILGKSLKIIGEPICKFIGRRIRSWQYSIGTSLHTL